jgi:phosphopantothenoylcysteine decarboxylase/phosphopantothenate--cysteine ligase
MIPDLLERLPRFDLPVYTILTENAPNVISPYNLVDQAGHTLIDSYFDPVMVEERQPGLTVLAPATFNTLNKLSQGIADTLAHSLAAESIGAGWPVIVAPSMNQALFNHPRVAQSIDTLRTWGVTVLPPEPAGELLMMASVENIVDAVEARLAELTG